MGFDARSRLSKAGTAAQDYLNKIWSHTHGSTSNGPDAATLEAVRKKNELLQLVTAKLTGPSATEMPPLICSLDSTAKAVFLVTIPIAYGPLEVSRKTYDLLAKHVGMSLNSVSHWALAVIDRAIGACYCYDLMSDQLALNMLGKSYFRVAEISTDAIKDWSSCYYVGETTRSHDEVLALGANHMTLHPRYKLVSSNCQDLVESLVKELCDGKIISQAKMSEELRLASPKIARDLVVARLRSRVDVHGEKDDSEDVKEEVDLIKTLWEVVKHRSPTKVDHLAIEGPKRLHGHRD